MESPITPGPKQYKPIPKQALQALLDHQCWLASGGSLGRRFGLANYSEASLAQLGIDYVADGSDRFDFSDHDLDGFDFSFAKLTQFSFKGSSLRGAWFIGAELNSASFDDCDATGARFEGADLENASFIGATYSNARFEDANLHQIDWTQDDYKRHWGATSLYEEGEALVALEENESKSSADIERIERFNVAVQARDEEEKKCARQREASLPFWRQEWRNEKTSHPLWRRTWGPATEQGSGVDAPGFLPC